MGLFSNPLRSREQRLPLYQKFNSPTKERFSNEYYYSSDDESDLSSSGPSSSSSRNVSGSIPRGAIQYAKKRKPNPSSRLSGLYPYRLPTKITRYILIIVVGFILLMILSLVRASQVENWKLENGKVNNRPPAPHLWEKFPFLQRYYGGIRTLVPMKDVEAEYPRLNEPIPLNVPETAASQGGAKQERGVPQSSSWDKYPGRVTEPDVKECFIDSAGQIRLPQLQYYSGRPYGFPQHAVGSYDVLKLPEDICFERYGRYGPYGFGYSIRSGGLGTGDHGDSEGSAEIWKSVPQVDFNQVDWADVQRRCLRANAGRYNPSPSDTPLPHGFYNHNSKPAAAIQARDVGKDSATEAPVKEPVVQEIKSGKVGDETKTKEPEFSKSSKLGGAVTRKSRTAVVVRAWDTYNFREDDIANLRSMITELAMASGGRFDIHLLVQLKEDGKHPIWADHKAYEKRIRDVVPQEFRGLVTLWTETQMLALYQGMYDLFSRGPDLPMHGAYRGLSMAMQYFAYMHPEYDYFWQWEADVRYTGHYYDLFAKLENWAKAQPRKGLWERNARFYVPSVHGSWDEFKQLTKLRSEMGDIGAESVWKNMHGAADKSPPEDITKKNKAIWGAVRPTDEDDWFEADDDPVPPTTQEQDQHEWGVGEEADYISLNPIFNPEGTSWLLKDDITGFNRSEPLPPRRANIITTSRMSRRLLMSMHRSTAYKKQFAFPEMWPATVALQHGYKAVFAPHPVFVDRKWPVDYMEQTYNGGKDGSSGGSRTSVFGDREHNLHGLSWFYNSGFSPNLYKRWMGLKVNNDGGEEFETIEDKSKNGNGVGNMPGGEGRMCLPPMLLHPVKNVEVPVEKPPLEEGMEIAESDPAA